MCVAPDACWINHEHHKHAIITVLVEILTGWQGLLQLLSLLLVCDDQCVQVSAAANLELDIVLVLLDLYGCRNKASHIRTKEWKSQSKQKICVLTTCATFFTAFLQVKHKVGAQV